MIDDRRLIEDYLPVDALNEIAGKEKKHPKHPVALIHYWPARRPITASRAAIYAALTPAEKSEDAKTAASQFLVQLAAFDVAMPTLKAARERIARAYDGKPPKVLDMFAGGGAIPLEASRLGCDSYALDYNPVAHLIELCTLVYPQTFGVTLASDVDKWGQDVLKKVHRDVLDLYPTVTIPKSTQVAEQVKLFGSSARSPASGSKCEPVSYIWVRTVPCRRPGCPAIVPLVRQAWLRKRGGYVCAIPKARMAGAEIDWEIRSAKTAADNPEKYTQTGAGESTCLVCTTPVPSDYVKECSIAGTLRPVLAAVVVDGGNSKLYLPPEGISTPSDQITLKRLQRLVKESDIPELSEPMNTNDSTTVAGRGYGISKWSQIFTSRQLLVLFTLVKHIRSAHAEMISTGMSVDRARAIATYLSMAFGRLANSFTGFCRWQARDQITIAAIGDRQALKMVYDFSEINPLADTAGCLPFALRNEVYSIKVLANTGRPVNVKRGNAEHLPFEPEFFDAIVTDPPYYSSIYYSDLSAFFYVWLKRLVGDLYPEHFALPMPPKKREAVAQPSEHDGDAEKADQHYSTIMQKAFMEARRVLKPGAPLVCVYAHKTAEGWASLIKALVPAGLMVTEAWPLQTEARGRTNSLEAASLSDSVFFVARKRLVDQVGSYESTVRPALEQIARERVDRLWAGGRGLGGADLLMAAVGAGLRPFTEFSRVEYANGETVSAERFIFEVEGVVLDTILERVFGLSKSSVSMVDKLTRFYVLWRFTYKESEIESGDAIVFCYPQGIEIDGPEGISGAAPALVEKDGSTYRVRTFEERGDTEDLGANDNGLSAPLIDSLHRLLWLMTYSPRKVPTFLQSAKPNLEQIRLVAQALCGPVLSAIQGKDAELTAELSALSKLTANWKSVIEGSGAPEEDLLSGTTGVHIG